MLYNYSIMKKLFGLSRRVIIGAAIGFSVAAIFFVAYQQQRASQKYKTHREEYCSSIVATAAQKKACTEKGKSARDYLPWGYILVSWPEGITTWAIIATGLMISWQSWETRKAAKASEEATKIAKANMDALISKERARIQIVGPPVDVSSLYPHFERELIQYGDFAPTSVDIDEFKISIINSGETTARDVRASYSVTITDGKNVLWHEPRVDQIGDMKPTAEPVSLSLEVFPGIKDEYLSLIHAEKAILKFSGFIHYLDAFSPERRTTVFGYRWEIHEDTIDLGEGRIAYPDNSGWVKSSDPGSNYQT